MLYYCCISPFKLIEHPLKTSFTFTVTQKHHHKMLVAYLSDNMPQIEQGDWVQLLASGAVKVDGEVVSKNQVMEAGQVIQYEIENYQEGSVDTAWSTLWHDQKIAVIHKPANLPVSRTTRNVYNTLVQLLRRESPWPDAHLLHRLDLETSGIILIGQSNDAASEYQPKLTTLIQRKIYHAIVHGEPDWKKLDYQCDIKTLKDSAIRCQMHKVELGQGKSSQTLFKVLACNNGFSLIECELKTGRKHQIRAHLSSLGFPIVGDKIYSNKGEFYLKRLDDQLTQADHDRLLTEHHLLHAYQVHINPDLESKEIRIITDNDYPKAWLDFCDAQNLMVEP